MRDVATATALAVIAVLVIVGCPAAVATTAVAAAREDGPPSGGAEQSLDATGSSATVRCRIESARLEMTTREGGWIATFMALAGGDLAEFAGEPPASEEEAHERMCWFDGADDLCAGPRPFILRIGNDDLSDFFLAVRSGESLRTSDAVARFFGGRCGLEPEFEFLEATGGWIHLVAVEYDTDWIIEDEDGNECDGSHSGCYSGCLTIGVGTSHLWLSADGRLVVVRTVEEGEPADDAAEIETADIVVIPEGDGFRVEGCGDPQVVVP